MPLVRRLDFTKTESIRLVGGGARSPWASSPILPKTDEFESALLEVDRDRLMRVQVVPTI